MATITILRQELSDNEEQRIVDFGKRDGVSVIVDETLLHIHDLTCEQAHQLEEGFRSWDVAAIIEE